MKKAFLAAGVMALGLAQPARRLTASRSALSRRFSGPTVVIGNDMRNSFELALDHLGRRSTASRQVIYETNQQKPDVGKQKTEKLVQSDKVDFIVGYIWSNVLSSLKTAADSRPPDLANAGSVASSPAELCSPYTFSTSWRTTRRRAMAST